MPERNIVEVDDGLKEQAICCDRDKAVYADLTDYFGFNDPSTDDLKDGYSHAADLAGIAFDYIIEMQRIIETLEESIS